MKINCITVDDEPLALGLLNNFVEKTPFLNLLGSYSSSTEALKMLDQLDVQLIFLDIQMPKVNGIEIARLMQESAEGKQRRVIFTTAYSHFAVESYRVDALDYLLKPFEYHDFLEAANKALSHFEQHQDKPAIEDYFFVRADYQFVKIAWDDIQYIEGLKDYVKIHLTSTDKPVLTLATLKSLIGKLPADRFMRIQRSFIISLDKVTAITKGSVWIEDLEITIGEQYKAPLKEFLDRWL
jgi:two-component system response regulator LytT